MSDIYNSLADSFEQLAAGYRALANGKGETTLPPTTSAEKTPAAKELTLHIEDVRAVLGEKSKEGKTSEIRSLLMKYDSGKLSDVKPEDYPALLREVEAL